jgi:hypothetical protein
VFELLDAVVDGNVSLKELMPPETKDPTNPIRTFNIPLQLLKEVRPLPSRKANRACLRFSASTQGEKSAQWKKLKRALDPEWMMATGSESIQIQLDQAEFAIWSQVLEDCDMKRPQQFIRFYEGDIEVHPQIDHFYMREGQGQQRWTNGQFYTGNWRNHVYDGHGQLFESREAYEDHRDPVYDGEWQKGKRHGRGKLRFQQDIQVRDFAVGLKRKLTESDLECVSGGHLETAADGEGPKSFYSLTIEKVQGCFEDWNRHNPATQVKKGDRIIEVNDKRAVYNEYHEDLQEKDEEEDNFADILMKELKRSSQPKLKVLSYSQGAAVIKTYEGQFVHDLFHGEGKLSVINAKSQKNPSRNKQQGQSIPTPIMNASQLMSFTGLFEADWSKAHHYVCDTDPEYKLEHHPEYPEQPHRDLNLEELDDDPEDGDDDTNKVELYFSQEKSGLQKAGKTMPDLAMALYKNSFGCAMHLKSGLAEYADGTEYDGEFQDGLPHGKGLMIQFEGAKDDPDSIDKRRILARYNGEWHHGIRQGMGTYKTWDGVTFEGKWKANKREGRGSRTQVSINLTFTLENADYNKISKDPTLQNTFE